MGKCLRVVAQQFPRVRIGLLAEQADPERKELLGNFPQAFSHVGLINAAWRLTETAQPTKETSS